MSRSTVSTHVLDATTGAPATGLAVSLTTLPVGQPGEGLGHAETDRDGRIADLTPEGGLPPGNYRLTFATGDYHARNGIQGFYPEVVITFVIEQEGHYHVPLLLSPYAYSTYRGS